MDRKRAIRTAVLLVVCCALILAIIGVLGDRASRRSSHTNNAPDSLKTEFPYHLMEVE